MKRIVFFLISFFPCFVFAQTQSNHIVIDQFGYLPDAEKIAIIRNPKVGFDSTDSFTPSKTYAVVNVKSGKTVFKGKITSWQNGKIDKSSGDQAWRFNFSSVKAEGEYYILDSKNNVKSYTFTISDNVYKDVLRQAVRTFYYQRSGFPKDKQFAGEGWADKASHIGENQDLQCRQWMHKDDASTAKDVHGGWYDAGDFNRYTNWTCDYIEYLLLAYEENPKPWTDDFGIPESGNGVPDILDEVRWGLEHILRLEVGNGSFISVLHEGYGTPPSANKEPTYWGDPSTSASLSAAAALAYGAKIFASFDQPFANKMREAAVRAWEWANANPEVYFFNNSREHGTEGLAAGQQEITDPMHRSELKLLAALRLFDATGDKQYQTYFDSNYQNTRLVAWGLVFPFGELNQDMLLYYTKLPNATPEVVDKIKYSYQLGIDTICNLFSIRDDEDPYLACQKDYVWGSNGTKSKQGSIYYNLIQYNVMPEMQGKAKEYAARYIHYLHGVNPLNKCYLTNMSKYGAENSVRQIYHSWFCEGNELWDEAGVSKYGPVPGFVPGGPNLEYDWDACCPKNCDSEYNNSLCFKVDITNLKNQPAQKSYMDINNGWPTNAWSVSEVSGGYQVQYIRLLSKFVK